MKDKVSELRNILNKKKTLESEMQNDLPNVEENDPTTPEPGTACRAPTEDSTADRTNNALATLQKKYDEVVQANATQRDLYLRQAAEFENFKKRLAKEQEDLVRYANEKILTELLPILDSLEMTLAHADPQSNDPIISGVQLILKQFTTTLEKLGITEISGLGQLFDPHQQEAIGIVKVEGAQSGTITQIHRKGYALNGRVVRAAMVTVAE
jgi:molecular chaperone GrpE